MKAYDLAKAEVGTVEWRDGDNPKVLGYFRDAGHPQVTNDETAWCAAFVGAMLHRAGMKGTGLLTARSYLNWGVPIDRKDAQEGDIVVLTRGNSTWQGHVGFLVRDDLDTITVLGGNQANAVNRRPYSAKNLLGIRRAPSKVVYIAPPPAAPQKASWLSSLLSLLFGGRK